MPRRTKTSAVFLISFLATASAAEPPSPRRVLALADETIGAATTISYTIRVEPLGAVALDQPTLDIRVRALRDGVAWRYLLEGDATSPDGQTKTPVVVWSDGEVVRSLDAHAQAVVEAPPEAAQAMMDELGVSPAISWLLLWDGLVTAQIEDAGTELPLVSAGPRLVDDVACEAVRVDYTRQRHDLGGVYDVWWFIDPATGVPARIEACYFRRDQNAYGFRVLSLDEVMIDPVMSLADLEPEMPAGLTTMPYEIPLADDPEMGGPAIGTLAPDWTLTDSTGAERSLSDYRGQVVVLDFWATWCGPCIAAMPELQELHEQYTGKPVSIIGLNMSEPADPVAFMRDNDLTYALMLEADEVANAYEVNSIPALFVIGPDGKVIYRAVGFSDDMKANLTSAIERALPSATEPESPSGVAGEVAPPVNPR